MTATNYRSAIGAQEPRRTILLDDVSVAYTDSGGSGPVLLSLHAIGHGARDFEDLSRRLRSQYRVIALDFPNHGNSGVDSRVASGSRYTEILSQFMERLNSNRLCCWEIPLAEPCAFVIPAGIPSG